MTSCDPGTLMLCSVVPGQTLKIDEALVVLPAGTVTPGLKQ